MLSVGQSGPTSVTRPSITDPKSCRQWLQGLPLTNVAAAHAELLVQAELLNQSPLRGVDRLKIMEMLREPVLYLQTETAKKYAGKPLPFDNSEVLLWKKALALWQALAQGYQICLQNLVDNDRELESYHAFICHRILRTLAQQMLEYHYAYQPVPEKLWRELHQAYAAAEHKGVARQAVKDPLNRMMDLSSPEAAYISALLICLADPYHMTARQLALADRWLSKWASRVSVVRQEPVPKHAELKPALVTVDLAQPQGASMLREFGLTASGRYLDTNQLAVTLLKRIRHLRKGGAPSELDMGDDCVQPGCETFLSMLYQQWCEPLPIRAYDRRAGAAKAQVTFTVPAVHFYVNGEKPMRQPGEQDNLSWQEMQDMQLFGQVSNHTAKVVASQRGYALENWRIADESALGFRLAADGLHAARIHQNQLVAVRAPDARNFALGQVRWLRHRPDGTLEMGVKTFPGIPMAIGVRPPVLISSLPGKYQPAFLLPEIPALRVTASLVLPVGWFNKDRPLEVLFEDKLTVHLTELLDKGADFERVAFRFK
jgi:hypothetical protein